MGALGPAQGVALVSALLLHVAAARSLEPPAYATFATVLVIGLGFQTLLVGGLPHALRRAVSLRPQAFYAGWRWSLRTQLPLSFGAAALLVAASFPLAYLFGDDAFPLALSLTAADGLVRTGLLDPGLQLLNGVRRHGIQALLFGSFHLVRLVFAWALLRAGYGLFGGLAGLLGAGVAGALAMTVVAQCLRSSPRDEPSAALDCQGQSWLRYSATHELLMFLLGTASLWLLKALRPDDPGTGAYAACFMMARVPLALGQIAAGGVYAHLAPAFAFQQLTRACEILFQTLRLLLLPLGLGVVLALSCGPGIVEFSFGKDYGGTGPLLGLLLIGAAFFTIFAFFGEALAAAGLLRPRLAVTAPLTLLSLPLSVCLISLDGPAGASWSLLAVGGSGALVAGLLLRARAGPIFPWRSLVRVSAAALTALFLTEVASLAWRWHLFLQLGAGVVAYGVGLFVLGELTAKGRAAHAGECS